MNRKCRNFKERQSWQRLRHTWLYSDLLQVLKREPLKALGSHQKEPKPLRPQYPTKCQVPLDGKYGDGCNSRVSTKRKLTFQVTNKWTLVTTKQASAPTTRNTTETETHQVTIDLFADCTIYWYDVRSQARSVWKRFWALLQPDFDIVSECTNLDNVPRFQFFVVVDIIRRHLKRHVQHWDSCDRNCGSDHVDHLTKDCLIDS